MVNILNTQESNIPLSDFLAMMQANGAELDLATVCRIYIRFGLGAVTVQLNQRDGQHRHRLDKQVVLDFFKIPAGAEQIRAKVQGELVTAAWCGDAPAEEPPGAADGYPDVEVFIDPKLADELASYEDAEEPNPEQE